MPKVEAWECPHTNKLFALSDEKRYRQHLRALSYERKKQAKEKKDSDSYIRWCLKSRAEVTDLAGIIQYAKDGFRRTFHYYGGTFHGDRLRKEFEIIALNFSPLRYDDLISNSHSAPLDGKQNWCGNRDKDGYPRGYPGWQGNIEIISTCDSPSFSMSDTLTKMGICTGSGGGRGATSEGHNKQAYDVKIWLQDWPGIVAKIAKEKELHTEAHVIAKLKGKPIQKFTPRLN